MAHFSHIEGLLPLKSVSYINSVYEHISVPFEIELKNHRKTRYGDYKRFSNGKHKITINNNLNAEEFLITLLHEIAHLKAFLKYGALIKPHGMEWKLTYKLLMLPLINDEIFGPEILPLIANHFKNPKASIDSDHRLALLLSGKLHDHSKTFLFQLRDGVIFTVDKKRKFVKQGKRTKKMICMDVDSGKRYLFHPNVEVELVK